MANAAITADAAAIQATLVQWVGCADEGGPTFSALRGGKCWGSFVTPAYAAVVAGRGSFRAPTSEPSASWRLDRPPSAMTRIRPRYFRGLDFLAEPVFLNEGMRNPGRLIRARSWALLKVCGCLAPRSWRKRS